MNPALTGIKNILFDLGGVHYAVNYTATRDAFAALAAAHGTSVDFSQQHQAAIFDSFEMGKTTPPQFLDGLRDLLGAPATDAELTAAWNAMLLGVLPGREALTARLAQHYPLALLSNTNALHWEVVGPACTTLLEPFQRVFLSHQLGLRKPEPVIFSHVLYELGWAAEETLFVEDTLQHIQGAQAVGLRTLHLTDPAMLPDFFNLT